MDFGSFFTEHLTWNLIAQLLMGAVAGWLAGIITGARRGLLHNVLLGVIGSWIGSLIVKATGIAVAGTIGTILISAAGACLFVWLMGFLVGRR